VYTIYKKHKSIRYLVTLTAVIISAFLQVYVIQAFMRPAGLLSGGFTGLAMLIDQTASRYGFHISTSVAMICLNVPVALLCSRSIGVRFTAFSLLQVFLVSFLLKVMNVTPLFDDIMLNVLFGGFLYGISIVIALRGNASSGGTDFIALYVSNKTGRSIWEHVFVANVVILCIYGWLFGWLYAGYSILFQFVSTKAISSFHHRYERVTLQITTTEADVIMKRYVEEHRHGISCARVIGGYSKKEMYLLHTVVSSYEVNEIVRLFREIDPHVIVNMLRTENFYGSFYQKPIE